MPLNNRPGAKSIRCSRRPAGLYRTISSTIHARAGGRQDRQESERFKALSYEELTKNDKVNLDIFWLKDEALEESSNLPAPEVIAADIAADLEAALEQFAIIAGDLRR